MSSAARKVTVTTGAIRYDARIGAGLLATLGQDVAALIAKPGKQPSVFVVTSPAIWKLWGEKFLASFSVSPTMLTVPAGEQHKRLATVERLAEEMTQAGADRDSVLIAFGGGVVGDMAGFLAAIYMRGIRYIQVPTTLLAQVDSSLGGKTGVNLAAGKNLIGSFHHPLAVFADTDVLATLPATELRAGLQESVKTGIIRDAKLFELLESRSAEVLAGDTDALIEVITASMQVKANVVEADEREAGLRMILNLGHTLGHAIEAATGYTQLLHGEAVAWGMLAAVSLARGRDLVTEQEAARMKQVIQNYGPMKHFKADAADLVERTARDKKNRSGSRSFVLPVGIGDAVVVSDVSEKELLDVTVDILRLATAETPR